jgi:hypothetical protein
MPRIYPLDFLKLEDPEATRRLDSETKAVLSYRVGKRNAVSAYDDLHDRIAATHRCQLTTDGLEGYIPAVEEHFGEDVDFAQLVKQYAHPRTDGPDWFRAVIACHRRDSDSHHWRPGFLAHLHLAHRTREPDGSDAAPPVHAVDQRVQQKAGEPASGRLGLLHRRSRFTGLV